MRQRRDDDGEPIMVQIAGPTSGAPVPVRGRFACWRRLAVTVLGVGALCALLLLAVLAVGYFLPWPVLLVPVTGAAAAVVYVTDRCRKAEVAEQSAPATGPSTSEPWLRSARSRIRRAGGVAGPLRAQRPWPTGRRRSCAAVEG